MLCGIWKSWNGETMAKEYYGWIGKGGYQNVIVIEGHEARVFNRTKKAWETDNEFLKAKWDPGSEFDQISAEEAKKIMERIGA